MDRKSFIKSFSLLTFVPTAMKLQAILNYTDNKIQPEALPVLFIGHGSPMNAIEENEFVNGWRKIAHRLHNVKAVLCVSAHWETAGTYITGMDKPKTIHDFGGFPQELFDVQYPAPGDPLLANEIQSKFKEHIKIDHNWGLDHGCWSVLKQFFPNANVPVLQLSLDYNKDPGYHYELAKSLSELRKRGILIIGSGNMVHNLSKLNWAHPENGFDWAIEANTTFKTLIDNRSHHELTNYVKLGKAIQLAVPTPEHFLPLLYVLAMQDQDEDLQFFNDATVMGSISMTSVAIGLN